MASPETLSQEPRPDQFSVALCQLTSSDNLESNVQQIFQLLSQLKQNPPDLVCFPENTLYMRIEEGAHAKIFSLSEAIFTKLAEWSKATGSALHLGSVPMESEGKIRSSSILIKPSGEISNCYQKIHLFDVDVAGHRPVRESDVFAPGPGPAVIEVKGWKFGASICYDLRFAELYIQYARQEVDAILIPSAFLVPTGRAHWHVLIRARAIESQCYVLAAAQGGIHRGINGATRGTFGHSIAVDPWGVVLAECLDDVRDTASNPEKILRVNLEREVIETVRAQIPMKNHRTLVEFCLAESKP